MFFSFVMVGMKHYNFNCDEMKNMSFLQLLREPENEFDKNAIKVIYKEKHIGYVSKSSNSEENFKNLKEGFEYEIFSFQKNPSGSALEITVFKK